MGLFREVQDEQGDGHDGGEHAEPERGGIGLGTHDGGTALGLVVRLDIDDVVLPDIVGRGVVDALRVGEVDAVGHLVVALLAEHEDVLAQAVDTQVACHGDGLEDVDAVLVDLALALTALADDIEGEAGIVDDDRGVEAEALAEDALLDHLLQLVAGEASYLQFTQNREVDGAVGGNGITVAATILAVIHIGATAICTTVNIKKLRNLFITAMDMNVDAVARLETDEAVGLGGDGVEDGEVLEVSDVLRRSAGGKGQERQEKEGEKSFHNESI